jgi:hypothetical protein
MLVKSTTGESIHDRLYQDNEKEGVFAAPYPGKFYL